MPDNIHQDQPVAPFVANFRGMDGVSAPHLIAEDEVQTSTNMDFTIEGGGASVRRGSLWVASVSTSTSLADNFLGAFVTDLSNSPLTTSSFNGVTYAAVQPVLYRAAAGGAFTAISTASSGQLSAWAGANYQGFVYFMGGNGSGTIAQVKDNGTAATDWIPQTPTGTMTIVANTLAAGTVISVWTASEGTLSSGSLGICDPVSFRVDLEGTITSSSLVVNGTSTFGTQTIVNTIGDFGFVTVQMGFDHPERINQVSIDFSLGTTDFSNYFHAEIDVANGQVVYPSGESLIQSQVTTTATITTGTTTTTAYPVSGSNKQGVSSSQRTVTRTPVTRIVKSKNTIGTWQIPRANFEANISNALGTSASGDPWGQVRLARIIIQGTGTFTSTVLAVTVNGANDYSLNDVQVGYSWWQTWAQIQPNTGQILAESSPSPIAGPKKLQNVNVTITATDTPTGTAHGITHRIFYRQGGYMGAPYAVGTIALTTTSGTTTTTNTTFTDLLDDISVLSLNMPMQTINCKTISEFNNLPRAITDYYGRLFILASNSLGWSLPGQLGAFPRTNYAQVSDAGDIGMALVPWLPSLLIINDHSVYVMVGNNFEGDNADYVIAKTGSKHGSKSRLVSIRTPYGIPLIDRDGIYMFNPSAGVDESLDWVMSKISDMWLGTGAQAPAQYKGNRLPSIDTTLLQYSCAAFANNRLYLGLPCSPGNAYCTHLVVIDFRFKRVYLYKYPFNFNNIFWDQVTNNIYVLTAGGQFVVIENGIAVDTVDGSGGGATAITYNFKTRSWAAPTEALLENIAIQYRGGTTIVSGILDQTNTVTIGSLTSGSRVWTVPKLGGTISNDVIFAFAGTSTTSQENVIYQLQWDAWMQPKRTSYYRTDYWDGGTEKEKIWDVHYTDIQIINTSAGTGTVLATAFIDNVAISTFTLIAPQGGLDEKHRFEFAYPAETYGNIEYTVYNAVSTNTFKLYGHHNDVRPEPPRVTIYDSDRVSGGEQWWRQLSADINPLGGTVTAVFYLDEVPQGTFSLLPGTSGTAGTGRQVFPFALHTGGTSSDAFELYGKVAYTRYSAAAPFKHYRTWYHTEATPDRITQHQSSYLDMPSEGVVKTWLAELQIFGTGTTPGVTGTIFADGTAITTATFTHNTRKIVEIGLPNITVAKSLKAVYNAQNTGDVFKHWKTDFEVQPKPFYKTKWVTIYKKPTAITQLDQLRFFQLDMETVANAGEGTNTGSATITSTWLIDGTAFQTNTFTLGTATRTYLDRLSFAPGGFGYLFEQQMSSTQPFHLWSSSLDAEHIGVKGFARTIHIPGTPQDQQTLAPAQGQIEERPRSYLGY